MGQIDQLHLRIGGAPVRTVLLWRSRGISLKVITSNLLPVPSLSIKHHQLLPSRAGNGNTLTNNVILLFFSKDKSLNMKGQRNRGSSKESWRSRHHVKADRQVGQQSGHQVGRQVQGEERLGVVQGGGGRPHVLPPLGHRLHPLHLPGSQRVADDFVE